MCKLLSKNFVVAITLLLSANSKAIVVSGESFLDYLPRTNFYDGIARVYAFNQQGGLVSSGTSSLLRYGDGQYLLTVAHLLTDTTGQRNVSRLEVMFQRGSSVPNYNFFFRNVSDSFIHPLWNGDPGYGNDIAILKLESPAPTDIPRYEIANGIVLPTIATFSGFGNYGEKGLGEISGTAGHYRVTGTNRLDGYWTEYGNSIAYDFDSRERNVDPFGYFSSSLADIGINDVMPAHGDSGGPIFVNGKIVSLVSFGGRYRETDIDPFMNSSFGEWGGGVNLNNTNWIYSVTGPIPEPKIWMMMLLGILLLLARNTLKARRKAGFSFFPFKCRK